MPASPITFQSSAAYATLQLAARDGFISHIDEHGASLVRASVPPSSWRLLCRSPQADMEVLAEYPSISTVQWYEFVNALVRAGWQRLPKGSLLDVLLANSRVYVSRLPRLPAAEQDLILLRIAARAGDARPSHLMLVARWAARLRIQLSEANQWHALVRRAVDWHARGAQANDGDSTWHFHCGRVAWRGYEIVPLTTPGDLWIEGDAMSHCLFDLRALCNARNPSRFFSVRRDGRRAMTLELSRSAPEHGMLGPDRIWGQWELSDCRLSGNRAPAGHLLIDLMWFAWQYNLWSQRPARQSSQGITQ
ncbi:hypothetical protein ACO2Q9_09745 [Variovorax sp. VNK109]|uniref:hypothetical protein n=1 Tax=Variovorax sp. VNK109 TaxID=3400919 RepID=UPI003C06944D